MIETDFAHLQSIIALNVKSYRKQCGLAQERLGLESGVDRTLVSRIERGLGNPTLMVLLRLSKRLGVTIPDLLQDQTDHF
jgi:transcriptional regulator with XRE-family HTH domain